MFEGFETKKFNNQYLFYLFFGCIEYFNKKPEFFLVHRKIGKCEKNVILILNVSTV